MKKIILAALVLLINSNALAFLATPTTEVHVTHENQKTTIHGKKTFLNDSRGNNTFDLGFGLVFLSALGATAWSFCTTNYSNACGCILGTGFITSAWLIKNKLLSESTEVHITYNSDDKDKEKEAALMLDKLIQAEK